MKFTVIAHIFQLFVLFTCLSYSREFGYIYAISFANPQVYIFFILPLSIIAFIFSVGYAVFAKKGKLHIIERVAIIIISILLSLVESLSTWFYILASTNLQTFIYILAFVIVLLEMIWAIAKVDKFRITVLKIFKRNSIKEFKEETKLTE